MKKKYSIYLLVLLLVYSQSLLSHFPEDSFSKEKKEKWKSLVVSTKKLCFPSFPNAFNPSIAHTEFGLLLTFRYCPDPLQPWISEIGIVRLDEFLNPIGQPQLLKTRPKNSAIPSKLKMQEFSLSMERPTSSTTITWNIPIHRRMSVEICILLKYNIRKSHLSSHNL